VDKAQSGATIEVRVDGPFVTATVAVKRPRTIRAGESFRPVLKRDPLDEIQVALITTDRISR
jgi:hypothetical protein